MSKLIDELARFLFNAKCSTFAGKGKKLPSTLPGGKEYLYEEAHWRYRDCYLGTIKDIGQEIVWYNQSPIWGMNYIGGIKLDEKEKAKLVFEFLKEALLQLPSEFPVRGPNIYKRGSFVYTNIYDGDLTDFSGKEYIFQENQLIYERIYHGGIIHLHQVRRL